VKTTKHRPRKRFGQHFLAPTWARKVVDAINPRPGDVFLEIGPGQGAMTLPLAAKGNAVLAVEIDRDLASALASRTPPNVTIVAEDFLETDVLPFLSGLGPTGPPAVATGLQSRRRVRVVGNLPYNLSTPILFRLIALQNQHGAFADATLMLQKEVADRLLAKPGRKEYGVLTIMLSLAAGVTRLLDLPPGAFHPAPKVRSTVIRVEFRPADVRITDRATFELVTKRVFMQRRKTLSNALKSLVANPPAVLKTAGITPTRRAETLSLAELARLADVVAGTRQRPVL
jgi:16S rRNA (adenine1518-N6/adenine1519-N6)-dimethyltransferase